MGKKIKPDVEAQPKKGGKGKPTPGMGKKKHGPGKANQTVKKAPKC